MFKASIKIVNNQYQVVLPLKQPLSSINLGDSFSVALRRFQSLEKKFKINPIIYEQYKKFIKEYISLGHAKIVSIDDYDLEKGQVYFMGHNCVIRENKRTTSFRVVFDGSMKSKDKKCINDFLYNGEVIQNSLFQVLVLFRTYEIVLLADIPQM